MMHEEENGLSKGRSLLQDSWMRSANRVMNAAVTLVAAALHLKCFTAVESSNTVQDAVQRDSTRNASSATTTKAPSIGLRYSDHPTLPFLLLAHY